MMDDHDHPDLDRDIRDVAGDLRDHRHYDLEREITELRRDLAAAVSRIGELEAREGAAR